MNTDKQSEPPRSARFMTWGELMAARPGNWVGTCRYCHESGVEGWHYSTRASICHKCAQERKNETIPSVVRNEKATISFVRNRLGQQLTARFLSTLTGVTVDYAQWAIDNARKVSP